MWISPLPTSIAPIKVSNSPVFSSKDAKGIHCSTRCHLESAAAGTLTVHLGKLRMKKQTILAPGSQGAHQRNDFSAKGQTQEPPNHRMFL